MERQKCKRCKVNLTVDKFKMKRCGDLTKQCIECNKKLVKWRQVHTKIKDFECDWEGCDYKSSNNSNLQRHIKQVHTKIKDFECDWDGCDYKCSTNSDLQRHIKQVHTKIKDFECDKCDYKCSNNSDLQTHIKTCVGKEKRFSSGEKKVYDSLIELGFREEYDFVFNQTFTPLKTYSKKNLRPDFLFEKDKIMIEYDGRQHFEPVKFGNISQERAEENFKQQQDKDELKNQFCKDNNYKMVRISYKDFDKVLKILMKELNEIIDWVG